MIFSTVIAHVSFYTEIMASFPDTLKITYFRNENNLLYEKCHFTHSMKLRDTYILRRADKPFWLLTTAHT
jgi:hypothetical protein